MTATFSGAVPRFTGNSPWIFSLSSSGRRGSAARLLGMLQHPCPSTWLLGERPGPWESRAPAFILLTSTSSPKLCWQGNPRAPPKREGGGKPSGFSWKQTHRANRLLGMGLILADLLLMLSRSKTVTTGEGDVEIDAHQHKLSLGVNSPTSLTPCADRSSRKPRAFPLPFPFTAIFLLEKPAKCLNPPKATSSRLRAAGDPPFPPATHGMRVEALLGMHGACAQAADPAGLGCTSAEILQQRAREQRSEQVFLPQAKSPASDGDTALADALQRPKAACLGSLGKAKKQREAFRKVTTSGSCGGEGPAELRSQRKGSCACQNPLQLLCAWLRLHPAKCQAPTSPCCLLHKKNKYKIK